jgi:protein SCO1/2
MPVMPAIAALPSSQLNDVAVKPPHGARLPGGVRVIDADGHAGDLGQYLGQPTVFVLADYTCTTLCGPIVSLVAAALEQTGLRPGCDYRLVVLGLDPKDGISAAREMQHARLPNDASLSATSAFLTADPAAVQDVTEALGYHYVVDNERDQIAHPAVVFALTANGQVARMLSGLAIDGASLRLALVEAGNGKIGTLRDQVHLFCYGFDPARGVYTLTISRLLAAAALATILALGGLIGMLMLSSRRQGTVDNETPAPRQETSRS